MGAIRNLVNELRKQGIVVHEWDDRWDGRGNENTPQIEPKGAVIHHTGDDYGYAYDALVESTRPDLRGGVLYNFTGNEDGTITVLASGLTGHAGSGVGPSLGALASYRNDMNRHTIGYAAVYPGTSPMTDEQYATAVKFSRIVADMFGGGNIECIRAHGETNGKDANGKGDGKWDPGYADGRMIDMNQFRRDARGATVPPKPSGKLRLMYDSTNPNAIPTNAEMVAGYVDGIYKWKPADWARFPNSVKVTISAIGAVPAQVGDVEKGCIWPPANAVDWVLNARKAGFDPTVYVNEVNDWPPTRAAFAARGVAQPHWWVARYNNVREVPPGAVARQFADPGMPGVGGHYDLSIVLPYWPGVDSDENANTGEDDMQPNDMLFTKLIGPDGKETPYNFNEATYWTNKFINDVKFTDLPKLQAQLDALIVLLGKATTNPGINPDEVRKAFDAALKGVIGGFLEQLRAVVVDAVDEDNTQLVDQILDTMAVRLHTNNSTNPGNGQ
jgi:hypothetical protein